MQNVYHHVWRNKIWKNNVHRSTSTNSVQCTRYDVDVQHIYDIDAAYSIYPSKPITWASLLRKKLLVDSYSLLVKNSADAKSSPKHFFKKKYISIFDKYLSH